jgi:hypothetical protein
MIDNISKEILEEVVIISDSFVEVIKNLGLDVTNNSIKKNIERKIKRFSISVDHFSSVKRVKDYKVRYSDKERLKLLVNNCFSMKEVLLELDLLPIDSNYKTLKRYLKKYEIDYSKFEKINNVSNNYNKDILTEVVLMSKTYKECLLKLNIRSAGGNYKSLKKYIDLYNIDTSHFNSNIVRNDKLSKFNKSRKFQLKEILIENSTYSRTSLKKRLYDENILERKCCLCGQDENWNEMKISLILDHINGVHNDNRIENLRIVCPNCNAGLDTFAGRNNKIKK